MSMSDPVADMLTRIRNAQQRMKEDVRMPAAKLKEAIAKILQEEGYVKSWEVSGEGVKRELRIVLKYYRKKPVIEELRRVSRPGLRCYRSCQKLPRIMGGLGTAIISTADGVMTDQAARKKGVGGEVLCVVR